FRSVEGPAHHGGLALPYGGPAAAEHRAALDQDAPGAGRRNPAAGKADDYQPPAEGDAAHRVVEGVAADRVEDGIGALAVGELANLRDEIASLVVDEVVRTVGGRHRELALAARRGEYARAEPLAHLDRGEPDAAGGAEHEQRLAAAKLRPVP